MDVLTVSNRMTLGSIWAIVLFSFVSLSASALSHILIFIPAFYGLYYFFNKRDLNLSKSMIALFFLVLFSAISVIAAPDIQNKAKQIFKLKYFVLGALAVFPYRLLFERIQSKTIRIMFNTFLVLIAIGNIAGIDALFDGYHLLRMKRASDQHRAAGMYGMAITYGYGIEFIVILMTALFINFHDKISQIANRNLFIVSMITCYMGFYFAFARGAVLAFVVSFPFVFLYTKKKMFKVFMSLGVLFIAIMTFVVFNTENVPGGNRLLMSAKSDSNMIRISQYQTVWKAFVEKPFTGWGYRNFEHNVHHLKTKYNIAYPEFMSHAHNNYLEFLASTGIFGFLSFVLFIFFWFWEMYKRNDQLSIIMVPFIVSLSVSGLFQNTITDGENMFVIMFLYALSQAFKKDQKIFN